MSKEDISRKHGLVFSSEYGSSREEVYAAMEAYALEEMTRLVRNMRARPIQCYSKKERGQEKEYYLGYQFIEDLIKALEDQYKQP